MDRDVISGIDVEDYYRRFAPMVWRRCRQLLGNEEAALDALQEVFVRLMMFKDRLKGTSPSSLLFRMATNHCLNKLRDQRRQGVRQPLEEAEPRTDGSQAEKDVDRRRAWEAILESAEERTRQAAVLYYIDGLNLKEISAELEMSVAGVHRRLQRLRKRIKR
jgi:RNA polymerase sigma-70 factor (ECF subfamily)